MLTRIQARYRHHAALSKELAYATRAIEEKDEKKAICWECKQKNEGGGTRARIAARSAEGNATAVAAAAAASSTGQRKGRP